MASKQPRVFYGFVIVAFASLICAVVYGAQYSFGVFFEPLMLDFGWTNAMTSGAFSLYMFTQSIFYIATGKLNDRFGPQKTVGICGFIFGLGYILMYQINAIWQMYIIYGVMIAVGVSGAFVPLASCAARWFEKMRGLMTGIVVAGIGVGTMVMAPLASWMIQSYGWRQSYLYLGIAFLVIVVGSAQFLRRDPSAMGLRPYGSPADVNAPGGASAGLLPGLPLGRVLATRQFWLIGGIYLCFGYVLFTTTVHMVYYATVQGISDAGAAVMLTVFGACSIAGKVLMGMLGDRKSPKIAIVIGITMLLVGILALLAGGYYVRLWVFYLAGAFLGLGYGAVVAVLSLAIAESFGLRAHGTVLGIILAISGVGGTVGPWLCGYLYDVLGSYRPGWSICAVSCVMALVLLSVFRPLERSRWATEEKR